MQHSLCSHSPIGARVHSHTALSRISGLTYNSMGWAIRMQLAPCPCSSSSAEASSSCASAEDIAAAWSNLKQFTQKEIKGMAQQYLGNAGSRARLRHDLMVVVTGTAATTTVTADVNSTNMVPAQQLAYQHPCIEESWNPESNPEVLLGIVASESRLAVRALRDWCQALNLQYVQPECKVAGASSIAAVKGGVYIKYNSKSQVCYLTQYQGRDRGVLVQLGPGRLLGHFPLGFFDEAMANPEPSLGPSH